MDKKLAKKVLFDIADVLESIGIQFFLTCGTCLGAYRVKNFIDWDNDVDLFTKAEEFIPKYQLLTKAFINKGYCQIKKTPDPFAQERVIVIWKGKKFHVDITSLFLVDNERWLIGREVDWVFPACFFDNPEQIDFLGRKFNVPTPVTEYLEWQYGPDYMMPLKRPMRFEDWPEGLCNKIDRNKISEKLTGGLENREKRK